MKKKKQTRRQKPKGRLKQWWAGRLERWASMRNLTTNKNLNKRLNYTILALETIFVIYALNSLYGCPCAYRTCTIKHFNPDGATLAWEASNLDCEYVQEYLKNRPEGIIEPKREDNGNEFGGQNPIFTVAPAEP